MSVISAEPEALCQPVGPDSAGVDEHPRRDLARRAVDAVVDIESPGPVVLPSRDLAVVARDAFRVRRPMDPVDDQPRVGFSERGFFVAEFSEESARAKARA